MPPATTEVRQALVDIVRQDLAVNASAIEDGSRLIPDLGLDSVAFAVALLAIEERLGIQLGQRELLDCETFGDVERLVGRHLAGASTSGRAAR